MSLKESYEVGGGTPGVQSKVFDTLRGQLAARVQAATGARRDTLQAQLDGLDANYAATGRIEHDPNAGSPYIASIATHALRPGGPPLSRNYRG